MGQKSLVFALPAILLVGAFAGCLEEKVAFDDLDDKFRGALGGASDSTAAQSGGDTAEAVPEPAETATQTATQTETQTSPPQQQTQTQSQTQAAAPPQEPEEQPQPTGACDAQVDASGHFLKFRSSGMTTRVNSKEGLLIEFTLNGDFTEYGVATTALTGNTVCNLQSSTVKYWDGWSKKEGTDQYTLLEDGDPYAASNVYQSVAGWQMSYSQPVEEYDGSGPDHRLFRYFAYARTSDGTMYYTPLAEATEGKGLVGVYYRHKDGRFYMTEDQLAHEEDF